MQLKCYDCKVGSPHQRTLTYDLQWMTQCDDCSRMFCDIFHHYKTCGNCYDSLCSHCAIQLENGAFSCRGCYDHESDDIVAMHKYIYQNTISSRDDDQKCVVCADHDFTYVKCCKTCNDSIVCIECLLKLERPDVCPICNKSRYHKDYCGNCSSDNE